MCVCVFDLKCHFHSISSQRGGNCVRVCFFGISGDDSGEKVKWKRVHSRYDWKCEEGWVEEDTRSME